MYIRREKNQNDFGWTPTTTKKIKKKLEKVFFVFFSSLGDDVNAFNAPRRL